MERPAILNRSMPRTPDAVIGFPAPRTTNVSVPKTKIYEANLHSFKGLQKKYSRCRAECEGQMNTIFEDTVDFRSCGPQLFNHKVKLPNASCGPGHLGEYRSFALPFHVRQRSNHIEQHPQREPRPIIVLPTRMQDPQRVMGFQSAAQDRLGGFCLQAKQHDLSHQGTEGLFCRVGVAPTDTIRFPYTTLFRH